ncbi:LamG-like jellyroll fold domain-containing protein [Ekhidna sp.]|uniref:LamG-like jellyroll fold domain-containing protein n=1 Tax=Ekhidna sp. TaxID=2608089 RepID=UPI0035127D49
MNYSTLTKPALVSILILFSIATSGQQALDMSGAGNEVNVTYNLDASNGFTVEQWVYIPTLSAGGPLVNQTNGNLAAPLDIYIQGDGTINLWTGDGTTTTNQVSGVVITQATWHHVAVVYDPLDVGNERKLYIDGNSTPVLSGASPALANIGPVRIGRRDDDFEGDDIYFDEVRVWNIPRNGAAINADYNAVLAGDEPNLEVYLRFENDLLDAAVGNGSQDGTIAAGSIGYTSGAPLVNNALSLDGIDDYVDMGTPIPLEISTGTVEAWINTANAGSSFRSIITLPERYFLGLDNNVLMVYDWGAPGSITTGINVADGAWHHVAFSFNSGVTDGSALYLDGEEVLRFTYVGGTSQTPLQIGAQSGAQNFSGLIDEVRVWGDERTLEELYNNARTNDPIGDQLLARWSADQVAGNLGDAAGNHTGTIIGGDIGYVASTAFDADIFPPYYPVGYPSGTNIFDNSFDLEVQTNEAGGFVAYSLYQQPSSAPVIDDVGSVGDQFGVINISTPFVTESTNFSGLLPGTNYDLYLVAYDGLSNRTRIRQEVVTTTGVPPNALAFDGVDDYVEIPDNPALDITGGITLETWVKFDVPVTEETPLITKWNPDAPDERSYSLFINNSSEIWMAVSATGASTTEGTDISYVNAPFDFEPGRWYHIAGTFSPSSYARVFVNGEMIAEKFTNMVSSIHSGTSPVAFAADGNSAQVAPGAMNPGVGMEMDEVRIWDVAKNDFELRDYLYTELTGLEANLIAYYDFNETSGTTLLDRTSNGNDGTLFNDNGVEPPADGSTNGPIWGTSGAFAPSVFEASEMSQYGFRANWQQIPNANQVTIEWSADNFASAPLGSTSLFGEDATERNYRVDYNGFASNARYQYRIQYTNGSFTSPYSNVVDFFTGPGSALNFDGTNDYVDLGSEIRDQLAGTSNITVEAWVYRTVDKAFHTIVGNYNGALQFLLRIDSNKPSFWVNNGSQTNVLGATDVPLNTWTHIAGTWDGTTMRVYLNGVEDGTASLSGLLISAGGNFNLGGDFPTVPGELMQGSVDEVRIWNQTLDVTTIQENQYDQVSPQNNSSLLAYYRFDEADGGVTNTGISAPEIKDLSGKGNDGTMIGFAKDGVASNWVISAALSSGTLPPDPTNVHTQTTQFGDRVFIDWVVPDGADITGSEIERDTDPGFGAAVSFTTSSSGEFEDITVSPDTDYFYRVRTINATGVSNWSAGEAATTRPYPGTAFDFDGATYITSTSGGSAIGGLSTFSIDFWINLDALDATIFDITGVGGNRLNITASGAIQLIDGSLNTLQTEDGALSADGRWHHVAVTNAGSGNGKIYLDGTELFTTSNSFDSFTAISNDLAVGARDILTTPAGHIDGRLDELRIWDYEWLSNEITELMFYDPEGDETLFTYKFDVSATTSPTTVHDRSQNHFDGTVTGTKTLMTPDYINALVTNTGDSGTGSLREAINYANANPGTRIQFNIDQPAPWIIYLGSDLPNITAQGTVIDGTTQPGWDIATGNIPQINGQGTASIGLNFASNNQMEVYGLHIHDFTVAGIRFNVVGGAPNGYTFGAPGMGNIITDSNTGISILSYLGGGTIQSNYIGIMPDGTTAGMGNTNGISLGTNADNALIGGLSAGEENVISNNTTSEISISGGDIATVQGNILGLLPDESGAAGAGNGININGSDGATIEQNVISGHTTGIRFNNSSGHTVIRNYIGVASDGVDPYPNVNGIHMINNLNSDNNIIGSSSNAGDGNIIAENSSNAILIEGSGNNGNQIQRNSIFNNGAGITLVSGAHNGILSPVIDPISDPSQVTGTGSENDEIDLYLTDGNGQGQSYLGTATVTGGVWTVTSLSLANNSEVAATATNASDGTSQFSSPETYSIVYPAAEGAGEALSFDGIDDEVTIPHNIDLNLSTRDFTIEAWINTSSTDGETILSKGEGNGGSSPDVFIFQKLSTGKLGLEFSNGSTSQWQESITDVPLGEWVHVAVTYNSSLNQVSFYINGVQDGQFTYAITPSDFGDTNPVFIGKQGYGCDCNYMNGEIDEIRIWDFVRSEVDIRSDLAQKVTNIHSSYANLLAYYRMDDSGDGTLSDVVGVNDGTINGGAGHVPSGAHLGDESNYDYSGLDFSFLDIDVRNISGAGPFHIYRVNQTPADTEVSGFNNIDDGDYYGIFAPGLTFDLLRTYPGVETNRRIMSRADGTTSWADASGFFGTDLENQRIYAVAQQDGGQYATALETTPYPNEQGAGYALSFDGSDDYVDMGDVLDNVFAGADKAFSIEAWIYMTTTANSNQIVFKSANSVCGSDERQFGFSVGSSGQLGFTYNGSLAIGNQRTVQGTSTLEANRWYHVAAIYDGSIDTNDGLDRVSLYINGKQDATVLSTTTGVLGDIPDGPAHLAVGSLINSAGSACSDIGSQFDGYIDEVRIWNTALNITELRQSMIEKIDAGHPNFTNLVAAYKFDENSGVSAVDLAGGNHGTITGAIPVISGAPQGNGSLFSYDAGPVKFDTSPDDDVVVEIDDASSGFHIYYVAGTPNQTLADGFNAITETKYYGVFAPGKTVDVRMDYNNGGSSDPNKRILYRENAADNAASGGWERLSGLINNDPAIDSLYAFNVPSGEFTIADLATPSSYPNLTANDPGDALDFDGSSQYVQGPDLSGKIDSDFTIEAWVNSSASGAQNIVSIGSKVSAGDQINLKFRSTDQLSITPNGVNGPSSGLANNDGSWHHIAGVYEGTTLSLYVDGVFANSITTSLNLDLTQFRIGIDADDASQPLTGQIDEVRIWNSAVAVGDIAAYANTTDISSHPNYSDMVAYYKFDDGTGSTILEDVFANNDGTLTSMDENTDWVASGALADAPEQNALNFDGTSDFVSFTRQNLSAGLTYEAWINTTSTASTSVYEGNPALTVIGDNDNSIEGAFGVHDGKVRYTHWTGAATTFDQMDGTVDVNDGLWHHIAVTHENGSNEVRLYVDGILDVVSTSTIYSTGISANRIGSSYLSGGGNDNFFIGEIDEVRIWNAVLDESEIRNNMYAGDLSPLPTYSNLLVHYGFNQGSDAADNSGLTTLTDLSSYGNDGTLNTFTLNGPTSNWVASGIYNHTPVASSVQAANISTSNITDNSVDISWTNGDGQRRIVAVFEGIETEMPIPSDNQFFHADNIFGGGDIVDGSWYAVYNGYGNNTTINGLTPGTDYTIAVLEVNGPPTYEAYNSGADTDNPFNFTTTGGAPSNYALDFDGFDDHVLVPDANQLDITTGTLEAWINPSTLDPDGGISFQRILAKPSGTANETSPYQLVVTNSGAIQLLIGDGATFQIAESSTGLVQTSQWQHIAATWDGSFVTFYYNGIEDIQVAQTVSSNINASPLIIGGFNGADGFGQVTGHIDEVRIWNVVRGEAEIQGSRDFYLNGNEPGLAAYYQMNDGTGSTIAVDFSSGSNDGTLINMDENTDWVSGPPLSDPPAPNPNIALDFDGTNDHLVAPDVVELGITNGTLEAWINPTDIGLDGSSVRRVLAKPSSTGNESSPYQLIVTNNGAIRLTLGNGGSSVSFDSNTGIVQTGIWQHIAVSWDGSNVRFYYDGVEDLVVPQGALTPNTNASSLIIGGFNGISGSGQFNGLIDEVRIWDYARTDIEIGNDRDFFLNGSEAGLVAYYPMSDGLGSLEVTEFTNGNNATLTNMDENTDWVTGPALNLPSGGTINFFEDFDNGLTASTDPSFNLSSGVWLAQGVQSAADIDPNLARDNVGDAAYMYLGTGNYLVSPSIVDANEFSFWYRADPVSAGTFDFDVYASSDGGTTFDIFLSSGSTDGTTYLEFTHSFGSPYSGPIQIIYTGGGSESGVIDDFASDGTELRAELSLSTLSIGNQTIAPGTADVLIYKMRMDVATADVTSEGFFITPVGSFDPSDIQNNSIRFYQSIGSDVADPVNNATFLGSTNIASGDPIIPDGSIGLLFTQNYVVDDIVYYYVVLNIDAGATPGNSFNIQAPAPNDNFGFNNADQFDNGLADGDLITIGAGDVTPPEVLSIEANDLVDVHSDFLNFTITFSEEVTGIDAGDFTLTTTGDAGATILTVPSAGTIVDVVVHRIFGQGTLRLDFSASASGGVQDGSSNVSVSNFTTGQTYTIDTYCDPTDGDAPQSFITNVAIGGINNASGGTTEYSFYNSVGVANLITNTMGSIFIDLDATTAPASTAYYAVWIDWNQDGDFEDADEQVVSENTYSEVESATPPNFPIPLNAVLGTTRMRVVTGQSSVSSCDNGNASETEDYLVEVVRPSFDAPSTQTASGITSTEFTANWDPAQGAVDYFIDVATDAAFTNILPDYSNESSGGSTGYFVSNLDFSQTYYYRVRADYGLGDISPNSSAEPVKTDIDVETLADSTALVQIYQAINPQGLNWTTARLRDWDGVTLNLAKTRVRRVDFPGASASGEMPNPFAPASDPDKGILDMENALSSMNRMNISNNEITGLMDFTPTVMNNLNVSGNSLTFGDLEPLIGITTLNYSNQASIQFDPETDPALLSVTGDSILIPNTQNYTVGITTGGSANQYTWYRNDVALATNSEFTVAGSALEIITIDYDNMGTFRAEVTSSLVPGLTIDVDPQIIYATAEVQMRLTDFDNNLLTGETFQAALLEAFRRSKGYDTLARASNVSAEFTFSKIVLGDYLCGIEPDNEDDLIPTYFGDAFQWDEAETIFLRADASLDIVLTEVPPILGPGDGDGNLDVLIEEDFGDNAGRIDARRRAAKRKCGLRKRRRGGRTGQDDDEFELIAYGETDDNGEFQFGFLPEGTYRFFVEYPGIPLDDAASVQFEVGEAGVSDTDFKLQAFATEDGIEITIEKVLGVILEYFKDLQIYPNPSNKYLNVSYRHLKSKDVTAQLVDLSGNTKWSADLQNGFDGQIRIDVSEFSEGVYILRFYDRESPNENVVSYRVIVRE